jgi:hypothetical protein
MKRKPTLDLYFFKLRHSHKANFQITTCQIPLKNKEKIRIRWDRFHEPSLRVHMKRGGGYMSLAVGVYETGPDVEMPSEFANPVIFVVRKWNQEFLTNTSQSQLFFRFLAPRKVLYLDGEDSMITEDTWAASSANVNTGGFRCRVLKSLKWSNPFIADQPFSSLS